MRLFVAVELPADIRARLEGLIDSLRQRLAGLRWVKPEGVHLTLKFLGEVAREDVPGLVLQLRRLVHGAQAPFEVQVRGVGTFPSAGRPRVLWVGVGSEPPSAALASLQERVEEAVTAASLPRTAAESRPFTPHLTLARWGDGHSVAGFRDVLQTLGSSDCGSFTISAVALMQSLTAPEGARYTRLEEFQL